MNEIGVSTYREARASLRKDRNYKRLIIDFEKQLNQSSLVWFRAKELVEPPLAMLTAHYMKGKIDNRILDAESGFRANLSRKEMLKKEISHFIYELENEVADMEEEFFSVHEMSRWLERFGGGNTISLCLKRKAAMRACDD